MALASLQEIRSTLVEKQVELSEREGPLYLLIDGMALGIRQFLTYEELLMRGDDARPHPRFGKFHRPRDARQAYFDALDFADAGLVFAGRTMTFRTSGGTTASRASSPSAGCGVGSWCWSGPRATAGGVSSP